MSFSADLPSVRSQSSDDEASSGHVCGSGKQVLENKGVPVDPSSANPQHPRTARKHTPETGRLISQWTAAAAAAAATSRPVDKASSMQQPAFSLAQYLPPAQPRDSATSQPLFDPDAQYCPAVPNDYHAYKAWRAERKRTKSRRRKMRKTTSRDHAP
ncbi:hypothetical protein IW150_003382 [Coemansia sp. RSA 2607]|nr:hypothetical protein IW150_003382 [Coemansia sp. RSA 2607]